MVAPTGVKYGGVLRYAGYTQLTAGDPQSGAISGSYLVYGSYDRLINVNPYDSSTLNYIPLLAEAWEFEDGGKTIVFHLRDDVTWHDGTPFTSEDVLASWERLLEQGQYRSSFGPFFDSMEAPDDYTAKFKLTVPLGKILAEFGIRGGRMMQKEIIERLGGPAGADPDKTATDHVGTGPYKFVSFDVAGGWVTERNDDYYLTDPDGNQLPYLDGTVGFTIPDEGTRLASFLGGQLDVLMPIAVSVPMGVQITNESPDHNVFRTSNNDWYWSFSNIEPFTDYRVRKAFHLAFDRHANALIGEVRPGWGEVWSYVPPYQGGLTEEELWQLPGWRVDKEADIAEANRLLDAAGLPRGSDGIRFNIEVISPRTQSYLDNAILYAADLRAIGIDFKIRPFDRAEIGEVVRTCSFQVNSNRSPVGTDPDTELLEPIRTPSSSGFTTACNWPEVPALTAAYLEQSGTIDPVARARLIKEMDRAIYRNEEIGYVWIPEHMGSYLAANWPYVHGGGYNPGDTWYHYTAHLNFRWV